MSTSSPRMPSLVIFGSIRATAVGYWQIRADISSAVAATGLAKDIGTPHTTLQAKKGFYILVRIYIFQTNLT